MAVATEIPELAVVEFRHDVDGHARGTTGVVVSAHPETDAYLVEIADADGRTVALVDAASNDLRVTDVLSA
jgi:quinolinate synthase